MVIFTIQRINKGQNSFMKRNFCISIIAGIVLSLCFNKGIAQIKPETMRQIQSLLDEKTSRTHAQRKMQSSLLQAARENRGEKMAKDVNLLPVVLKKDASGNIKIDITGDVTESLLSKIRALGGEIIYPSKEFHSLRASVPLSKVETIAGYSEVKFIQPAVLSKLVGASNPKQNVSMVPSILTKGLPANKTAVIERREKIKKQVEKYVMMLGTGSVNSEGDHPHRADDARNAYGYMGQGIKIGVLSDSYNNNGTAAASVASGNLPGTGNPLGNTTPVTVLQDNPSGGTDEGQAMLQIVHDIAPKAQLYFATGNISEASFATNIKALRTAGCDIIIDDLEYFDEPPFQDGIVAQAVNTVTASGALYFSSAGNQGSLVKGTSSVFESDFNNTGSLAFGGSTKTGGTIHNFGTTAAPVNGDIITTPETTTGTNYYTLAWADPLGKSSNDYDLFLVSSAGTVKASSTTTQSGSQDPIEFLSTTSFTTGDRLVVYKTATAATRAFSLNGQGSTLTLATNGQTHGHSCAVNAFCVAATPAAGAFGTGSPTGPYPGVFTTSNKVEVFSSDGPRRMFFNADSTAITANNFLFATSGGAVRNKPDITAADGVSTTLSSFTPFFGTSAAAPHAGAIAALLKSANSSLTAAQIRTILINSALDIEGTGYDINSGNGILQAYQAMQAVNPTPLANLALGTTTVTEGTFSNGNGSVEPGELGKLVVQLSNPSLAGATAVTATLTTNTSGITITQGSSTYGTIASGGNATNTATPFLFAVNSSVACGTVVTFYVTVTFTGGLSPQIFSFTTTVGSQAAGTISSKLGSTPPTGTNFTSSTGTQTGRINRNTASQVSSCASPLTNPGLASTTGARQYDAYVFKNTSSNSQCVNVTLAGANAANLFCVAYSNAGFVPSNPSTNFLADGGNSFSPESYSFTAPAGQSFTVVVHSVDSLTGSLNAVGSAYTLNVSLANCAAPLTCNTITVTPASLATGATGTAYSQIFTATGGSGSGFFTYVLTGSLPAGLTFSGSTISGTPTQAGNFPISITANDPTGCTVTKSYTLTITGITAASIAATAGTPQTTTPGTAFPTALKATVYDASHTGLPGAKVIFAAPSSGASGTFPGGALTDTIVTDANGVATAATFTANGSVGSYTVTASVAGVTTPASFSLTNTCASSFIVTSSADSGPGTLRDIITNACTNITVTFDPSVTKITLTSGEIAVNKAVTITGTGANVLTVSGNNLSRIFNITAGTSTVSISGMTIRDGLPQAGSLTTNATNGGGGILINSGTVNITGCVITNNNASNTGYAEGGGIDNEGTGVVTINNCTISNNTADFDGGGIAHWGTATMVLSNSTVAGNVATGLLSGYGLGGGVFVDSLITITNSTIYGNSGYVAGGNILNNGATSKAFISMGNTIVGGGSISPLAPTGNGRDIYGLISSAGYNLIQLTGGYTISGTTTGNMLGTNPKLLTLGNYGGTTTTLLPMSNSPVINAGNTALTSGTDQRGLPRVVGGQADIGAVEVNYATAASGGTPQSTIIKTAFATALQTKVTESGNNVAGDSVVYVAPTIGASGTFSNSSNTVTVVTNSAGVAAAPTFTANGTIGTYTVASNIGSNYPSISFILTNTLAANSPITIFPNPVITNLTVGLPGTDIQTVSIYDVIGRLISQYTVAGGIQTIPTNGWAKGMYILTVTKGNDRIYTIKLIKD